MRRMKDSGVPWIGEIPEEWEFRKLKSSIDVTDIKETYSGQNYIGLENIESHTGKFINTEILPSGMCNIYSKGDILFSKLRPYLCKCILANSNGVCSTEFIILNSKYECNNFFKYVLTSPHVIDKINSETYGAKMPRVNWDTIGNIKIPIPDLSEQQRIADYLDTKCAQIDATIASIHTLIDKLKEYKQSVITEAVTKGLDPDVPMKDSGVPWIGEIPERWGIRRLKKISDDIVVGIVINPSQYISEDGLPYIYGGDIHDGKIGYITCRKISDENSKKNIKTRLSENDILTVRVGYPGLSAVVPPECEGGNCASVILTRKGNFNSFWYCYCMNSNIIKNQIDIVKYGAAQEQFNLAHMLEFLVPYPPLNEQQRIAAYLDATCARIDAVLADKQALLDKLAEYKKSLIFECVTGKREVPA